MNKQQFRPFCFLIATVILVFAIASTVNGQQPHAADKDYVDCWDQQILRPGEGSYGFVPSWFVLIKVEDRHSGTFFGSGAFITDRVILTCYHNIRGSKDVDAKNGAGVLYTDVKILLTSPKLDLALLKVEDEVVPYHRFLTVSDTNFKPKGVVHSVGYNPSDDAICRYEGTLTGKSYGEKGLRGAVYHGHSAKVVQGMSGGPLLDNRGRVVGVNVSAGRDGEGLATNLTRLQWFLDQLPEDAAE